MALASKSSATRCRARCTSRWAKRCEKAVAPGSTDVASQCRFILQSPRCRIASHVPKCDCINIIYIHLWYWQSLRKSSCPKPGNKVGPKPVASCTKRWRSWKQTWNWNKPQKNPSKHPIDEFKKYIQIWRPYQNFRMDQMYSNVSVAREIWLRHSVHVDYQLLHCTCKELVVGSGCSDCAAWSVNGDRMVTRPCHSETCLKIEVLEVKVGESPDKWWLADKTLQNVAKK